MNMTFIISFMIGFVPTWLFCALCMYVMYNHHKKMYKAKNVARGSTLTIKRFWSGLQITHRHEQMYWNEYEFLDDTLTKVKMCSFHSDMECCLLCLIINYSLPLGKTMYKRAQNLASHDLRKQLISLSPRVGYETEMCVRCGIRTYLRKGRLKENTKCDECNILSFISPYYLMNREIYFNHINPMNSMNAIRNLMNKKD